jgi:hypothetical protein
MTDPVTFVASALDAGAPGAAAAIGDVSVVALVLLSMAVAGAGGAPGRAARGPDRRGDEDHHDRRHDGAHQWPRRAEVAYAVTYEAALHVEDVLMRTGLFIESADSGTAAAAEVNAIMGRLLGWSRRRRAAKARRYVDLVRARKPVFAIDPGPVSDRAPAG